MSLRSNRKKEERKRQRQERKDKRKNSIKDRIEEFKLNRQGKTKRKRTDVMSRHRKIGRILTLLIVIVGLLLLIVWGYILFI